MSWRWWKATSVINPVYSLVAATGRVKENKMIRVGLGQAEGMNTRWVTQSVIDQCRTNIKNLQVHAGIIFASPNFDHQLMLQMVTRAFPGIQLIGCTSGGDFTTVFGFSDDSISLMVFHSDIVHFSAGSGTELRKNGQQATREALHEARTTLRGEPKLCLTFPRGTGVDSETILNLLTKDLGDHCPIFGGASATLRTESETTLQFCGSQVMEDGLPILLMSGQFEYSFGIANSWRPLGRKGRITSSSGNRVMTIDNKKAVDFYQHYLGKHQEPAREFLLAVYEEGTDEYFVSSPLQYNDDGSIDFFSTIKQGAEVQLTEATREELINDTEKTCRKLAGISPSTTTDFGLAFSCSFRKEILGTSASKEVEILGQYLPQGIPLMGFCSFGEIAPLHRGGRSFVQGATLITLLISSGDSQTRVQEQAPTPDNISRTEKLSGDEKQQFLERKLQRSESYRARLESIKDFNGTLHRQIMGEIEEARQRIEAQEKALRKSEEKFRRIVQTAGEGFILLDRDLAVLHVNDAYSSMTGYSRAEMIGKTQKKLRREEFRLFDDFDEKKLLERETASLEGELVTRKGTRLPVLVHRSVLRDDGGELMGHMAFITDLSEQKKALALAGEVQRSLLPQESPRVQGLDIAGRNVSCQEVGGDYYDFFFQPDGGRTGFSLAVGDITGHGVDAALLMSSARAFLRMHVSREESVEDIVRAMNDHLAEDVQESGRFMTLFYLSVAPDLQSLEWIRAGHDPAFLYDPATDQMEQLMGPGVALGVEAGVPYQSSRKENLAHGQIIAIGTDGIWESRNSQDDFFGRDRFAQLLRDNADCSAAEILNNVFQALEEFREGRRSEDDVTLVIVKIQHTEPH